MPVKEYDLPGIGPVKLYKRKGVKSLRLSVTGNSVRVTLPYWAPYQAALEFVRSRQDWIESHKPADKPLFRNFDRIGKAHHLIFREDNTILKPKARIMQTEIIISYPIGCEITDATVQEVAAAAAIRAMKMQADKLLPQRLRILAAQYNFTYRSVKIRQLKARWGSCDSNHNIALNLFLMQLPWDLIDYVLVHELTHTKALNHGTDFWELFESCLPNAKTHRKLIKGYAPVLEPLR